MILAVMYANKKVAVKPKEIFFDTWKALNFFQALSQFL